MPTSGPKLCWSDRWWAAAHAAGRLFACGQCGTLATVHRACDRGQRYCSEACAGAAHAAVQRRAGARYQATVEGRTRHAARQRAYRLRLREGRVTHHGAAEAPHPATTSDPEAPSGGAQESPGMQRLALVLGATERSRTATRCCAVCGQDASRRLRQASLRQLAAVRRGRRARRPP